VNGWLTKDLLTVMAQQQNAAVSRNLEVTAPVDHRLPAPGVLVVLGLALALVTSVPSSPAPAECDA